MAEFKVGDVVHLKSYSPKMTVTWVGKDGNDRSVVACSWFNTEGGVYHTKEASFPPDALVLAR